ncbi:MAG TPA: cbb3-type cytochrome oxidase assembly protein CcoS [Gammaproteobacteria bacterium]|nr:cbb3-type cytochrome oxidase assembly protein CcoS [Gammaproteobacteria bacterium]
MNILYLLIPIGLVFLAGAIWLLLWAIRSGQYDDLEGPAFRVLMDDDDPRIPEYKPEQNSQKKSDSEQKQGDV